MQEIEEIKGEEEDYKDNIPENLQGGEKYEIAENAIENLEEAYNSLDDVVGTLEDVESYMMRRQADGRLEQWQKH